MRSTLLPAETFNPTLEERVYSLRLPSGLRAVLCPKPGFKKRYACYSAFYGSLDVEFAPRGGEFAPREGRPMRVPAGIAHFLEHALFETEEENASDIFARRGAYSNAATSFTTTTYLFSAADRFHENLELLLRFVENPVFDPDKVEKERGIIEQEIRGYKDDPQWVGYMSLMESLFEDHPFRIDIAGTVDSIREIDSETLHACYRAFYHPANMVLFAVGDIDAQPFFEFVAEKSRPAAAVPPAGSGSDLLGDAQTRGVCRDGVSGGGSAGDGSRSVRRIHPDEAPGIHRRETRKSMEVALSRLLLGFKEVRLPHGGEDYVLHDLASELALEILFGRSSDSFRELYEAGLILDDFGASYGLDAGVGFGIVGGETPDPDRLRDALFEKIVRLRSEGIRAEDFERTKRLFLGGFIRSFNSLEYVARSYTHFLFHDFDLFGIIDLVSRLDRQLLERRIEALLDPERCAAVILEPGAGRPQG